MCLYDCVFLCVCVCMFVCVILCVCVCFYVCVCLTIGPGLVDGGLLAELLRQVVETLQTADLVEQPLLVAFLRALQRVPRPVDVLERAQEHS